MCVCVCGRRSAFDEAPVYNVADFTEVWPLKIHCEHVKQGEEVADVLCLFKSLTCVSGVNYHELSPNSRPEVQLQPNKYIYI